MKNKIKEPFRIGGFFTLLVTICCFFVLTCEVHAKSGKEVDILFTHDFHSHLEECAKIKTLADEKRRENPATFFFDGGDFSMGTAFQSIYETDAAELVMLGRIGVDATTFGNHEFDYRSEGVSNMFHAALKEAEEDDGLKLPKFLIANIDWKKNQSKDNQLVQDALEDYGSSEYSIIEKGGYRIGVYGIMGKDSAECAPESGLVFEDIVDTSKRIVKELQKEKVDMIVCLSHSGTFDDADKSEDEILAKEVPEIDVIISGHSHTILEEPIVYGNTIIASSDSYGKYLGQMELTPSENGRWNLKTYQMLATDENVKKDQEIEQYLEEYRKLVDQEYLSRFGYTYDQVLAENHIPFTNIEDFSLELQEDTLGNLISDSYVYAVKQAEGDAFEDIDLAVVPSGVVRDSFKEGELTTSDVFNVSALGIGKDRITGYPLVSVYLTGEELKTVAEIDASISGIMNYAQLYPSGMSWSMNPYRMILNRVTEVNMVKDHADYSAKDKVYYPVKNDKLYRVVSGLYSAQMLGAVQDKSKGILKITPKDKNGEVITNFEDHIIYTEQGEELKEWYALASYLQSFPKNEKGIPEIPDYYRYAQGRKNIVASKNIIEILKKPNKIAFVIYIVLILVIALIVGICKLCYNKILRVIKGRKKGR